jgi:hypothetical protein
MLAGSGSFTLRSHNRFFARSGNAVAFADRPKAFSLSFMKKSGCIGIAAAVVVALVTGAMAADLRVLESNSRSLRLEYKTRGDERELFAGNSWLVGLPIEGEVRLEVIEASGRREPAESELLTTEGEQRLSGPVFLGKEGFVRDQRVVELGFAPRRSADGSLEVFERVVVELHFSGGRRSEGPKRWDRWGEAFLQETLVNYEQARQWRRPRMRRAARPALQDDGAQLLRVWVRERGFYRLTGADLEAAGVSLNGVDPTHLRMFYGGGKPLSVASERVPVVRKEIGIVVEEGEDGRFDAEDFVLFYGAAASRWDYDTGKKKFIYLHNLYTHENAYWLEVGGSQVRSELAVRSGALQESEPLRPESYRMRVHEESEQFIQTQTYTIKSGYGWYWEDFHGNARNFSSLIRGGTADTVDITLRFIGLSGSHPTFTVKWNDETVAELELPRVRTITRELQAISGVEDGLNQLGLVHTNDDPTRLDWYELEYSRRFLAEGGELFFDSPVPKEMAEFRLSGFEGEKPRLFETSKELVEIVDFAYDAQEGTVLFQDIGGTQPRQYAAVVAERWKRPLRVELDVPGQLLEENRGAEYVIVTHRDFLDAAERLAAWRASDDRFGQPLRTMVVDVQDIYDEFSGGMVDPTAIRNFFSYAADHWELAPFFALLMGDGTYDYKNNSGTSSGNWIPAFQDGDSTYDEWYVRVAGSDILPDMAIGRLPVRTAAEADGVVEKLISYDREPQVGPWQSRMLLVADDLANPEHPHNVEALFLIDSENLARNLLPEELDLRKLYLAQFPLEGRTKPRAREEFIRRFNEGALILTYLGHGNPDVLAHEQMFVVSRDLGEIDNGRRLPFFYTAASQVGVFDDPVRTSMPEALLKLPDAGVIGMISATRVGYHDSNMILANAFHAQMYRSGREYVPVGLALMEAKQMVQVFTSGLALENIQRYSLFGDPATRLAVPRLRVELELPDSLRALEEIEVEGRVLDEGGQPVDDFDGQVWFQAFDSSVLSRLGGLPYQQVGVALFRGLFAVEGGRFAVRFRVPKDITYRGIEGRVSAYAWSENYPAAFGAVGGLVLAGTAEDVEPDGEGPEIRIGFEGKEIFSSGGQIGPGAVLRATIGDPSGINVTGETGHEIEIGVDQQAFKVTELFSVLGGDYREGILEYPLPALEPGEHEISLKAWDSHNNSSQIEVLVKVSEGDDQLLTDLLFYPNPLRGEEGFFTFDVAVAAGLARIQIFALSGRLVDEVEGTASQGYNQVAWRPNRDLANGTYLYRVSVQTEDGKEIDRTAVLQVIR